MKQTHFFAEGKQTIATALANKSFNQFILFVYFFLFNTEKS